MGTVRKFDTGATRDSDTTKPDYVGFTSAPTLKRVDDWVLRERDLAWAGGLFEGEGYIGIRGETPELQLKTTDEDTIRHFLEIVGGGKVYGPYQVKQTALHKPNSPWRPYWSWQVRSQAAIDVAKLLFPYLQSRRRGVLREKWGVYRLALVNGVSPLFLKRFGEYMLKHQTQPDGSLRSSDNWKKGIPFDSYMESLSRHYEDVRLHFEGHPNQAREGLEEALCAMFFNVQGYLHELLKENDPLEEKPIEQVQRQTK